MLALARETWDDGRWPDAELETLVSEAMRGYTTMNWEKQLISGVPVPPL